MRTEGLLTDGVLLGLQAELPGAEIQFDFTPGLDEAEFVHGLIAKSLRSREMEGFVLSRSTIETQRLVHTSGLPAVVLGHLYPSIDGLCQIDRDQRQIGMLLTEYLLKAGCERIAVLLRNLVLPGDNLLLDGVFEVMGKAGRGFNDLIIRCLPLDESAARATASDLLSRASPRLGFLCRTAPLATAVKEAANELKLTGPWPAICTDGLYLPDASHFPFAYTRAHFSPEEIGREVGRLLLTQAGATERSPVRRAFPVNLTVPSPSVTTPR